MLLLALAWPGFEVLTYLRREFTYCVFVGSCGYPRRISLLCLLCLVKVLDCLACDRGRPLFACLVLCRSELLVWLAPCKLPDEKVCCLRFES